jgi:hypothetical protein
MPGGGGAWRGWHVIARFLPMLLLGVIFLIIGFLPTAPHIGAVKFGVLFLWVGGVLIVGAVLGMLFTKCPTCNRTVWIACLQERDVQHDRHRDEFYRDLAPVQDEE